VAANHLDTSAQFAAQPRRHTDGVQAGDSIRAIANGDANHVDLLSTEPRSALSYAQWQAAKPDSPNRGSACLVSLRATRSMPCAHLPFARRALLTA
jgi:hypothetical protein